MSKGWASCPSEDERHGHCCFRLGHTGQHGNARGANWGPTEDRKCLNAALTLLREIAEGKRWENPQKAAERFIKDLEG
jgi:hypothetical protein